MPLIPKITVIFLINLIFISLIGPVCCAEGDILWTRTFNIGGRADYAYRVATDSLNNIAVFGSSWNGANYDFTLVKYDYNGTILWNKSYNGGAYDYGYGVGCDSNNNIIATGWRGSWPDSFDIYTIKYDSMGNVMWQVVYNSGRNDRPYDLVVDHNNNIFIVGVTNNGINEDVIILKYDTGGNLFSGWPKSYNGPNNRNDEGYSLAIDSNNNLLISGISNNGINNDYLVLKYDTNGNLLWPIIYDAGGDDKAYGIICDYSNNPIVTGKANGKIHTIKYSTNGNMMWERDYLVGANDEVWDIEVDTYNNLFLVGEFTSTNPDFLTIKYDQNGNFLWRKLYQKGADERAYSVAVDSQNNIIIGGFTGVYGTNSVDFLTIKYEGIPPAIHKNRELPMEEISKILNLNSPERNVGELIENCEKNPEAEGCSPK